MQHLELHIKVSSPRSKKEDPGTYILDLGADHYEVPSEMYENFKIELEPYRVEPDQQMTFDDLFGQGGSKMPEWASLLRGLRHREALTQKEFAKAISIPQSNLSAMENGKRPIGKEMAKRIARTFQTDYRYFL